MRLYEYQSKELFEHHSIPVPKRTLIERGDDLTLTAKRLSFPCVVKAQLLTGGRGKAGLVQVVESADDFSQAVEGILQRSPATQKLLCEEKVDYVREIYFSITVDPKEATAIFVASSEGGVEIETVAHESPESILHQQVDIIRGRFDYQCREIAYGLGLGNEVNREFVQIARQLYHVFRAYDAQLVEINPLFVTKDNHLVAGDAKVILDDNASFRQTEFVPTREHFESDTAFEAAQEGIPYVQFDGDISLMCAGAGLTTTVFDLVSDAGGKVSNYLEFGGPNYTKAVRAMELCLANTPKVVLVVTFGTIARADVMAQGISEAIQRLRPEMPIVTCIRGTNEEEAFRILRAAGLEPLTDTEQAVERAVALSREASA